MASILTLHVLTTVLFCCCCNAYINNFRFKHSNVFKGDVIPFKAIISGTYYLDYIGTPELAYVEGAPQKEAVKTMSLVNDDLPVVCTGDTAAMIVKQDASAHRNLTKKLTDLARVVEGKDPIQVAKLMASWNPFIPIMESYSCQKLTLFASRGHGYTFRFQATFDDYKPIIFMDSMGMGMFNYKRSFVTKHSGHASGNPIRFCGGSAYTGDMFTVEPRPKCPLTSTKRNRHHGHAIMTVYKPNIVSVRRNVTRCLQRITHVHAYQNIFATARDAYRKTRNVHTSPEDCRKWKRTKSACETFKAAEPNGFFSLFNLGTDDKHCKFEIHFSQNLAATEYETNPYLNYDYSTSGGDYESRSATLSEGFMEVSMPSRTIATPWATIPKEMMSKGEYELNNVTIVWDPFTPDDLCLYVPRFRGEVSYIKYKHGDYNVPIDPTADTEDYTLFLMADQYGAMFNVESSQEIKDVSKLNCMPHKTDYNTKVFQTGTDQVIVVTMTDRGDESRFETSHIPEEMRHRGAEEQIHSAYTSVWYDAKRNKVLRIEKDNEVTATTPSRKGDLEKGALDLEDHYNKVKSANGSKSQKSSPPKEPNKPNTADVLNYINYKRAETQRENLHVRAMQNCFINQIDWDMYTQLLDINPSRAISNRINMAVEASLGGNGFYNVKKCEMAIDTTIIPTLRTSSEEIVSINGNDFSVKQLVNHLGVESDADKCFAMPLVVFRSGITGTQVVGQVTMEGVINTQKLSYLEACSRNKAHIFMINDHGHFFVDYKKEFTDTAANIMNATEKFLQASLPVESPARRGTPLAETQMKLHALSKIHILSIVQPTNLKEKEYSHFATGLFRNDIYSLAEHQSISLGLIKLMEEQNFERFAAREFNAEFTADRASIDQSFLSSLGAVAGGAGDFFLKVEQGNGALLYGMGRGVGAAAKGLGQGVGSAEKGIFQGIGDALSSTLMALVLPLVCVVVLAIIGVVIYKQITGKPDANSPPSYYESMKDR